MNNYKKIKNEAIFNKKINVMKSIYISLNPSLNKIYDEIGDEILEICNELYSKPKKL
jgi:uncharacterized pyridoxamine 5'-phosphate oxidase family protein